MPQPTPPVRMDAVLIESANPEALAEFYRQGFELPPPRYFNADHLGFSLKSVYLGLERVSPAPDRASGRISIWFAVPNVEAVYRRLLDLGAKEKSPPKAEGGEILATVLDPDGNVVGLIQPELK